MLLRKRKGSALLVMAVAAALLSGLIGLSTAKVQGMAFNAFTSSRIAMQAQEYAAARAELLKSTKYEDLAASVRSDISGASGWQDEVLLGAESAYPGSGKIFQRRLTVNVYQQGESQPRCSLSVLRYSAVPDPDVPKGAILPWYGKLSEIPDGFLLCDGSKGTPDLRNRFLVGAGGEYALAAIGGEKEVKLAAAQQGSHYHYTGFQTGNNTGHQFRIPSQVIATMPSIPGVDRIRWNGSGGWQGSYSDFPANLITSLAIGTAAELPHENRPPYYALYYIMRV